MEMQARENLDYVNLSAESSLMYLYLFGQYYSDTPKFVPRKMHHTENFVDRFIL